MHEGMRIMHWDRLLATLLGAMVLAACGDTAPAGDGCARRWQQPDGETVLDEQRRRGPAWRDHPLALRAADAAARGPAIEALARFTLDGAPLLYFSPDLRQALVRDDAFGDLTVVAATHLRRGDVATLGVVRPAARHTLGELAILELLVRADIIQTYVHIGSELCIADPVVVDGVVAIAVHGSHTFMTNKLHRERLQFVFRIDAAGIMTLTGS